MKKLLEQLLTGLLLLPLLILQWLILLSVILNIIGHPLLFSEDELIDKSLITATNEYFAPKNPYDFLKSYHVWAFRDHNDDETTFCVKEKLFFIIPISIQIDFLFHDPYYSYTNGKIIKYHPNNSFAMCQKNFG